MKRRGEAKTPKMSNAARKSLVEYEKAVSAYLRGFEKSAMMSHVQNNDPNLSESEAEKCFKALCKEVRKRVSLRES